MPVNSIARLSPNYAHSRVIVASAIGLGFAAGLTKFCSIAVALLGGWDAGGLVMLLFAWSIIWTANARETEARAAAVDPGARLVYVLVVLTATVSLFSAIAVARHAEVVAPSESTVVVFLCLLTVGISWFLANTAFVLRYAHLYYRDDDEGVGGIDLPGNQPATYFDFAYFGFTIGMCFQVSDAVISSQQIRKTVLLHAIMSFAYNTAVLAFALNLAFGSFG
ncbi:MAG: DUF1345 domain-containing protein [Polyangiaceae bacterium]|nr:DUF1345 domain-containing protein [Polyangiaceae bacterium]